MKDIKYLCIDDQRDNTVDTFLQSISAAGGPQFDRKTPIEVGAQIDLIIQEAKLNIGHFGVLLDLRLDMEADVGGNRVPYRGPTLAQELRTRMAEGTLPSSFPIILWSIAAKFEKSYSGEETSHDLFDAVYGKDKEIANEAPRVGKEMCALAVGYSDLCESKKKGENAHQILKISKDDAAGVYFDFACEFDEALQSSAINYPARLITSQLIRYPGLLVDESLLAARLGIDIGASEDAWQTLCENLNSAAYKGPFSTGWNRWWWNKVEDWWSAIGESMPNIRRLTASERTLVLKERLNIALIPAKPICEGYSEKFFTLCAATNKPMDPIDGFRVSNASKKSWQDTTFVSIYAAINRINKESWGRIHPLDRDRFDAIKEAGGGT